MKKIITVALVLLISSVFMMACGGETLPEVYGPELDSQITYSPATVEDVFVDPELYDTHIVIEAIMVNVCPAGCWLYIGDDNGSKVTLYVSRNKDSFTVPIDIEGRKARVYGKVVANNKGEMLEGHRVEMID